MARQKAIQLTGDEVLNRLLSMAAANVAKIVGQALTEEAQITMRASARETPVKDGFLKASGTVNPPKFSYGFVKVTMGYGGAAAEYALYVHNSPYEKNWTKAGTKSHFLSDPLQKQLPSIEKTLIRRIGRIMGR